MADRVVTPCLEPVASLWSKNSMAKAPLKIKPAMKSALTKSEALLRTKSFQRAAILLKQVSDPTRLQIIAMLSEREYNLGDLGEQFNMTQPGVSHHVALLRLGGIIERRRDGKKNFYTLTETGYELSKLVDGMVD